ncbi:uncharacterized protein LOC124275651 isoform X1 [Haliotis rubra]|uniref:uncharacterized protein LOC124275651 isoform X1 n=1 Tax=Haliotis rubra TaxID=36100 RepID=UPI001EE5E077|nr:uncharacterized protein LOC124275651 isoform X1 [Haliotis rubra]
MFEPSNHSSQRGRLPPIHAIGKVQSIDEDDPPYVPVQVYGYDADGDLSLSSGVEPTFEVSDAEDAVKLLRKTFQLINPGRHACKRSPEHGGTYFVHCRTSSRLGKDYSQLRKVLENRAKLEFVRDCVTRIRATTAYVEDLEGLVLHEYRTAYAIRHGCAYDAPISKLYCLNALCEDLRVHVNHWNVLKQHLNTNKWLQPILGRLCLEVEYVKRALIQLCDKAIWLLQRLINVGFEVFAHCDVDKLTPEVMWNITRGLEDFNNIVNSFRTAGTVSGSQWNHLSLVNLPEFQSISCLHLHPAATNFPGKLGDSVKAIPFPRVLRILANERSRYAAKLTHYFFTVNEDFQKFLNCGRLPLYNWFEDHGKDSASGSSSNQQETSDYHTATGSNVSLSTSLLRVGSLRAPDLSVYMSPLVEFSHKEQEFAENFLLIVCNSTTLLRKNDTGKSKKQKELRINQSPMIGRSVRRMSDTPVLSRADSRRKTVSWGDNADQSIRNQVVAKYMEILWQHFGENLELFLLEPTWDMSQNLLHSEFGSILLYNDTLITLLRHTIEHVCMKDLFPPASVQPLLGTALRLHIISAYAAWDQYLTSAISSQGTDKCYPCPLMDGEYSTRTGMLLRDTFKPMYSLIQEVWRDLGITRTDSSSLLVRQDVDLSLVAGICLRVLMTCRAAHSWCMVKTHQFLASWSVSVFLLITHTDLKMLVDETKQVLYYLENLTQSGITQNSTLDLLSGGQISQTCNQLTEINAQLQSLCGASMKLFSEKCGKIASDYFRDTMPLGKQWRRKTALEAPVSANLYVEQVLEAILEPVIDGVSKLNLPSQLSVISMATVAICEAWTNLILKEKIKFSVPGAQQLGIDFTFLKSWIGSAIANPEVKQSVLDLSIFKFLNGIVLILKKQPKKRTASRLRDCSAEDLSECLSCEYSSDVISPQSSTSKAEGGTCDCGDESDICSVPNMDDWLALRVHGGTRSWRLPSCFSGQGGES